MLYYDEVKDYSAAKKYFNMVDESKDFPDQAKQAKYYAAICDSKINKSASFDTNKENIFAFQDYNSDNIDDTNPDKYTNYLNIAYIYLGEISNDPELANRIEVLMDEAMKNLDDNAEVLNSQFPADRGVKYYNGQYSGVMYSVYTELAENADDAGQQLH